MSETTLYLIRHAKAGHREQWSGPDHLRPLTKAGWRQAEALIGLLEDQPLSRLLSSPYVRCTQTFDPLARARGLHVENADGLAEGAYVDATFELMLGASADGPAALSTHGDVVQNVLDELQRRGVPLEGPLDLEKGSAWILDVSRDEVAGGRYVPPP